MKPIIKILTPYYNELIEPVGATPIEQAIAGLKGRAVPSGVWCGETMYTTTDFDFVWTCARCTSIADGRNGALNHHRSEALYQEIFGPFTHYLSTDVDVIFDYSHVVQLIDAMNTTGAVVVGAAYNNRHVDGTFCAGRCGLSTDKRSAAMLARRERGLQRVDFVGMGCTLIDAEAVTDMAWPYFERLRVRYICDGQKIGYSTQEDEGFCYKVRDELGGAVYCNCDCVVGHVLSRKAIMDKIEEVSKCVS